MSKNRSEPKPTVISSTTGRQVVVGHDEYINKRTGAVEEFAVIRSQDADWNFEKIWLFRLIEVLDLAGSAKIKVLTWMLDRRDNQNRVIATQSKIATGSGVSLKTVNRLLSEMREEGLITSVQSGVYRLDPCLIWKGSHKGRMNVLMQFEREASNNAEAENEEAAAE